jgi:hypothetical protein
MDAKDDRSSAGALPGPVGTVGKRGRPKRASRRRLRIAAAGSTAVAFALPWLALRAAPRPPAEIPQVFVVRGGGGSARVVHGQVMHSGRGPSLATTRASGAPPIR